MHIGASAEQAPKQSDLSAVERSDGLDGGDADGMVGAVSCRQSMSCDSSRAIRRAFSARSLVSSSDSFDIEPVPHLKTDIYSQHLIRILGPYAVSHKDLYQVRRRPRASSSRPCWIGPSCGTVASGCRGEVCGASGRLKLHNGESHRAKKKLLKNSRRRA